MIENVKLAGKQAIRENNFNSKTKKQTSAIKIIKYLHLSIFVFFYGLVSNTIYRAVYNKNIKCQ